MKYRTGFVTNSSSANYCITLNVEGTAGEHAKILVHTYDGDPWYEDTEDGCENHDRRARVLSYHVNHAVNRADACEDVRELSDALLSAIREYGWGLNHDWWQEPVNGKFFKESWRKERLLEARAKGAEEDAVDCSSYDFHEYIDELRSRGRKLEKFSPDYPSWIMANAMPNFRWQWYRDLIDNICRGWRFAIVGTPCIYESRAELESYIVEHGGAVDDRVQATTDFVIYCLDGRALPAAYWTFDVFGESEDLENHLPDDDEYYGAYEWKCYEPEKDEGLCDLQDYCDSFEFVDDDYFAFLFKDALGDALKYLDVSYFVIPEHEFIRRFDPEREREDWMPYDVAHPIIAHRFAQVLESRGITPKNLKAVSYKRHISTFGDSTRLLGFYDSDRGTDIEYDGGHSHQSSWGDDEDIDQAYRED